MTLQQIPWDDAYLLGIKKLDAQHKHLFDLVNKLYNLKEENYTKEELRSILYKFSEYMKTHFHDEESYMQRIDYPAIDEHKKVHAKIIDSLHTLIETPMKLPLLKSKMKIVAKRSLIDHILYEDIKIKKFAQSNFEIGKVDEEIFELS